MECENKSRHCVTGPQRQGRGRVGSGTSISQAPYYQWRDQFLPHAGQAVEVHQHSQRETRLQQENARLKHLVGELTLELKQSDAVWE
ncbi:MAG: hypothetical protein D6704_09915 [Nitrospirae bacterium]|nr:MAG: hypothetical protein D6704_09915 [Nitrospirota bacterium]